MRAFGKADTGVLGIEGGGWQGMGFMMEWNPEVSDEMAVAWEDDLPR
jgi:hypothetical protein